MASLAEERPFEERFFAKCPARPRLRVHRDHQWLDVHGVLYTAANVMELEVIRLADWLIDLGPEGGDIGGEIVFAGTPEEVARHKGSYTGEYLKRVLKKG